MIAVAAYCVLALTVALAGLGITACILVGPGRDTNRGLRWLWRRATRDMPAPADTQAIQDPPDPVQAAVAQLSDAWIAGAVELMWALPSGDAQDAQACQLAPPPEETP